MFEISGQIQVLDLAAVVGAILFLAGLIWLLVENRPFEGLDHTHDRPDPP